MFGGDAVPDKDTRPLFYFPHRCGMGNFGRFSSFFLQSPADFHDTRSNDWCWQGNESTTFLEQSDKQLDPNPAKLIRKSGSVPVEVIRRIGGDLQSPITV